MPPRYDPNHPQGTGHGVERPANDPGGGNMANYLQSVLGSLNPVAQATWIRTYLTPAQIKQYGLTDFINQQNQSISNPPQDIGTFLYHALGSALGGLGGSGGGGGGGGGGASGPSPAQIANAGRQLGLSRDQINTAGSQLDTGYQQSLAKMLSDIMYARKGYITQQQGLDLQKSMGLNNFNEQKRGLIGGAAARGSNATAGVGHQRDVLGQQFNDLMKQYGFQQTGLTQQEQQTEDQYKQSKAAADMDYFYGRVGQTQQKQGLNLQAGAGGYADPFANITQPVGVGYTGKAR